MRWAVLLWLVAASCAPAPEPARPLREFRGIVHCHTLYSHDSRGTYEEIVAAARAARIDFVCITDHPPKGDPGRSLREGWRGMREGVLFIQGHELAGSNLLALGIREPVPSGSVPEKIAAIRRQGGVALVSHPEEVRDGETYRQADGMEIYNIHAAWKRRQRDLGFYAQALRMLKDDPERVFSLLQELDPEVQARWEEAARGRSFAAVAGNDAHQNVRLGGIQVDPYERSFRFVSTHVWAEELTEEAVLEAIRRGRCHVAFAAEGPPPGFPAGGVPRVIERGGRPWLVFGGEPRRCDLDWPRPMQ